MFELYNDQAHRNLCVNNLSLGHMVDANQHIIIHDDEAMLLDPGGHKIFTRLFSQIARVMPINNLKYIFFSHQDPDIIASANGWLMTTDIEAFLPSLWMRFITHFGVDKMVSDRIIPLEDDGRIIHLGGVPLKVIPAHFLHSPGNYQIYDPESKILYSGDLGASIGCTNEFVQDFDDHIQYMKAFHQRYMAGGKAMKAWANTVRHLNIETIAPQHGSILAGREIVRRFIDWIDDLPCGIDLLGERFTIPE